MMAMLALAASPSFCAAPRFAGASPDTIGPATSDTLEWDDSLSANSYAARRRARSAAKDSTETRKLTVDSVLSTFGADTISQMLRRGEVLEVGVDSSKLEKRPSTDSVKV